MRLWRGFMLPEFFKQKPTKVVAVGLNYHNHAKEVGLKAPRHPLIFLKPVSSIISSGEKILIPKMSKQVDYEGELALVIKDEVKDVEEKDVFKHILGFTCLNDVTARDLQRKDGQWTRAKSFDTFCPIGPRIVKINPDDVRIMTRLNGIVVQDSSTNEFIFGIAKVVSFISKVMTLYPYDVITTGTPPGIGPMKHGDIVEVEIEGIGVLRNIVSDPNKS